jgi:hypothetical protein
MPEPRHIVVVEDLFIRQFLQAALRRLGYRVTGAMPAEATRLLLAGDVDLLITNNPSTFADFGADVPLLYLAAFPDIELAACFRRCVALRKPFQTSELRTAVEQLLGNG